jgi:prepilin-type N-terminal cleavage/methylation domain-containing protein
MRRRAGETGFSLIEVMLAIVISGIVLMGTMGAVELATRYIQQAGLGTRALEVAQSRLEVKRSVRWRVLLEEDLDDDGLPETSMRDDGQGHDVVAGDNTYTATRERDGVTVVWTMATDRSGPLSSAGMVTIHATATFEGPDGQKQVRLIALRANPAFVGPL